MKIAIFENYEGRKTYVFFDDEGNCSHSQEDVNHLVAEAAADNIPIVFERVNNIILKDPYQLKPIIVEYCHDWVCGGSEEGGWYYSQYSSPIRVSEHIDNKDLYNYQITEVTFNEFILGEHENTATQHYQ